MRFKNIFFAAAAAMALTACSSDDAIETVEQQSQFPKDGVIINYTDANNLTRECIVVTLGDKKYAIATANETSGTPTWTVGGVAYYNFADAKNQFANNTDSYSAANVWRLPTQAELNAFKTLTNSWQDAPAGRTWTIGSASLFLPAAGYCDEGEVDDVGVVGDYWSSTPYEDDFAYRLDVDSDDCGVYDSYREYGFTVRLFCQLPSE